MSALPAVQSPPAPTERKALITLGDEQITVRLDGDGHLTRTLRRVRLTFGLDLYYAGKNPGPMDKVQPYQPGYMRVVSAMGGQLGCPPTVRDPVTRTVRANPVVETWPDGIVRRVTATAACAVRHPITGEWVVSFATIVQDLETVLRQALLKLVGNDELAQLMSADQWEEVRKTPEFRGWHCVPLANMVIACNLKKAAVKEAWDTLLQQAATARQRTMSKAERLACDHNPVTRMTWYYGNLKSDGDGPRYAEVPCVAWVEGAGRDKAKIEKWLEQLATEGRTTGVENVIDIDPVIDNDADDEPGDIDEDRTLIEEQVEIEPAPTRQAEPVRVEPVKTEPAKTLTADEIVALDKLRSTTVDLEAMVTPDALKAIREAHGIHDVFAVADAAALRTYRRALQDAVERGAR